MTVTAESDLVEWAAGALASAGIESSRFEAQLLLAFVLDAARSSIVARTYPAPTAQQVARYRDLVAQRMQRVPSAYLRGTQEFYGHPFLVTPAVLVPRPETELLVERAGWLIENAFGEQQQILLADVGTGSGCLPLAIGGQYPAVVAVAFDVSWDALQVARLNAYNISVDARVRFVLGDLLTGVRAGTFDLIVSNPPYIASEDIEHLQPEVRLYEPRLALDGGADGLSLYRRLITQAKAALKETGWLCMEVGYGQAQDVAAILGQAGYNEIQMYPDLAGIDRVVCGQRPPSGSEQQDPTGTTA